MTLRTQGGKVMRAAVVNGLTMFGAVFPARAAELRPVRGAAAMPQRRVLPEGERGTRTDSVYLVLYGLSLVGCAVMSAAAHGARERHKEAQAELLGQDGLAQAMEA